MNYKAIGYILGLIMMIEAALMAIPIGTSLFYGDGCWGAFLSVSVVCLLIGGMLYRSLKTSGNYFAKEGFVIVTFSWIIMSLFGAIPFVLSGNIPSYVDALFETISGFTTTGATVVSDVEALAPSVLVWRSLTHWIGGMGILVFMLAILPLTGGYNVHLMRVESPGPQVDKLVPKIRETARILYSIYIIITLLEMVILVMGGMSFFDSFNISLATAGTGGFGVLNDSCGSYSVFCQTVIGVFMVLFGVNFNVYYLIYVRKYRQIFKLQEVRLYLLIIALSTGLIAYNAREFFSGPAEAVKEAFFQVASIITTTGFSTTDFDLWPSLSKTILVALMFIGACASSTGGGMKVSRVIIALKLIRREVLHFIHPRSVNSLKVDGRIVDDEVKASVGVYFMLYGLLFAGSVLLVSINGYDFTSNFTAVAATINNIGPGLESVGPVCNYGGFSILSKIVLMVDMLAGRLELFPILVAFSPRVWKR
ncbi:MAG: TrkH family potassium uptake protein [Eubacterium sp.]|nr:TrkH family potassium uptake protein [Eubacterium sp.]